METKSFKIAEGEYYEYPAGQGVENSIKEMQKISTDELRLWIIQELSCPDSECWWLIDIGIAILKKKMENYNG